MSAQRFAPEYSGMKTPAAVRDNLIEETDPIQAAEVILRRYGARSISMLTAPRTLEDGRVIIPRLSANDCYVALEDACRKVARVALRNWRGSSTLSLLPFKDAVDKVFPDPAAYLARAIRSVISDAERHERREPSTISLDRPFGEERGSGLSMLDTLAAPEMDGQPEEILIDHDERSQFRSALEKALRSIPHNYLEALQRDISRDRRREHGASIAPESDRERQTVCRARAALTRIIKQECGEDNPFVHLLMQQRSSRVRRKQNPSAPWTSERQSDLFRRLLQTSWKERASASERPDDNLEEAVVNEVSFAAPIAPPSPEMRESMRVLDTYTIGDQPTAQSEAARNLYDQALAARKAGRLEEAAKLYRSAYDAEPNFFAALNEVGVLQIQMGNLRDALKAFLSIIDNPSSGDEKYIAATNAADIYLTWFDTGRNRESNISRAAHFASMAMQKPTPMRTCNLLLAYAKDKYYREAHQLLQAALHADLPECKPDKLMQTLFQIRDPDLISWWKWLESELGKEERE